MTLQRAICKSIRTYTWHSLLASLPLFAIVAVGIKCFRLFFSHFCNYEIFVNLSLAIFLVLVRPRVLGHGCFN